MRFAILSLVRATQAYDELLLDNLKLRQLNQKLLILILHLFIRLFLIQLQYINFWI